MTEFLIIYGDNWKTWGIEMKTLIKDLGGTWNESKVEFNINTKADFEKFGVLRFGKSLGDVGTWDNNKGAGIVKIFKVKDEAMLAFREYNNDIINMGIKVRCLVQKVELDKGNIEIICNNKKRNFLIKTKSINYNNKFVQSWLKVLS